MKMNQKLTCLPLAVVSVLAQNPDGNVTLAIPSRSLYQHIRYFSGRREGVFGGATTGQVPFFKAFMALLCDLVVLDFCSVFDGSHPAGSSEDGTGWVAPASVSVHKIGTWPKFHPGHNSKTRWISIHPATACTRRIVDLHPRPRHGSSQHFRESWSPVLLNGFYSFKMRAAAGGLTRLFSFVSTVDCRWVEERAERYVW